MGGMAGTPRQLRLPKPFPGPKLFVVQSHRAWKILKAQKPKLYADWDGHHGIPSAWMEAHYSKYSSADAPVIAMPSSPNHANTVGVQNHWVAETRRSRGWGKEFHWDQITEDEIKRLADKMNAVADVTDDLWKEYTTLQDLYVQSIK